MSYERETEFAVWSDLSKNLEQFAAVWRNETSYPKFQLLMGQLYRRSIDYLWMEPKATDSDLDILLRPVVLKTAGLFGEFRVVNHDKKLFITYLEDQTSISSDLRCTILILAIKNGGAKEFHDLSNLLPKLSKGEETIHAIAALGYAPDEQLISTYLDFVFLTDKVPDQDLHIPLISACSSSHGLDCSWNFMKKNWSTIYNRLSGNIFSFSKAIGVLGNFTSEEKAKEVIDFFASQNTVGIKRTIEQAVETIYARAKLLSSIRSDVTNWLVH